MADGLRIPGTNVVISRGNVINNSDAVILCWVQDEGTPDIFQLGPGRSSPLDRDVDAVKAEPPNTLVGSTGWFKFSDVNTATVSGQAPSLDLSFFVGVGSANPSQAQTDEAMLQLGGLDPSSTTVDQFIVRGSAFWWGGVIAAGGAQMCTDG